VKKSEKYKYVYNNIKNKKENTMVQDNNSLADRYVGDWEFTLYQPLIEGIPITERIFGHLFISKDHYYIMDEKDPEICWYNVAVQNVARVRNMGENK
jgi:hypothetical protein